MSVRHHTRGTTDKVVRSFRMLPNQHLRKSIQKYVQVCPHNKVLKSPTMSVRQHTRGTSDKVVRSFFKVFILVNIVYLAVNDVCVLLMLA
jgi:hypothetical protein